MTGSGCPSVRLFELNRFLLGKQILNNRDCILLIMVGMTNISLHMEKPS